MSHTACVLLTDLIQAQAGAFELLGERLKQVAEKARTTLSPSVVKIVDIIQRITSTARDPPLIRSALQSLSTISETLSPGEEGAVSATVPSVLGCVSRSESRVPALGALLAFS